MVERGPRGRKATARGRVREGDVPPPARSERYSSRIATRISHCALACFTCSGVQMNCFPISVISRESVNVEQKTIVESLFRHS